MLLCFDFSLFVCYCVGFNEKRKDYNMLYLDFPQENKTVLRFIEEGFMSVEDK